MRYMRTLLMAAVAGLALTVAVPAIAQQVDIKIPAPERAPEPMVIPPGDHTQATRPSDADYYPYPPRVRHDPAFIGPLSTKTESTTSTGRVGIAGWTSPATPVGAQQTGYREVNGWFSLGFAVEWGGPPPAKRTVR